MSVQINDAGVSVTFVILSVVEVFDGNERFELIEKNVNIPVACCSHSFVVLFINLYGN